jgi:SAM-dependent methyltransferase
MVSSIEIACWAAIFAAPAALCAPFLPVAQPTSSPDDRALFYERFAPVFDERMNRYEVEKRLRLIFDDALADLPLAGVDLLDAGCGTGLFSAEAVRRGAGVTSLDVGEQLLARVADKCDSRRVVGTVAALPFGDASFDVVICTEVIEHVENAAEGIAELVRVARPGGRIVLTTPNRVWQPAIWVATQLRLRPYEGMERWIAWRTLRARLVAAGAQVIAMRGFNAIPFVHPALYPLVDRLDRFGSGAWGRLMINMMAVATKPVSPAE